MGIFEDAGMYVQEVDGANDIGKDLYVDLTDGERFTGEMIAVQVKSGRKYVRADGTLVIPSSTDDRHLWANSSVPVFGFVLDPDAERLGWVNLTAWSRLQDDTKPHATAECSLWRLTIGHDQYSLNIFLKEARGFLRAAGSPQLLGLADDDERLQVEAVFDAFAIGRHDARALRLLRRCMFSLAEPAVYHAVRRLILAAPLSHGDIMWSASNWIEPSIKAKVATELSTWTLDEVERLLDLVEPEEWRRGSLGQDVAVLVGGGWAPDVECSLREVVRRGKPRATWSAALLLVEAAGEAGLEVLEEIAELNPRFGDSPECSDLRAVLLEAGWITIF